MISIITPVLNEQSYIHPFLVHLNTLQGDFELIFVDGGSSDTTLKEIHKYKETFNRPLTLVETSPGRGHQMNAGAAKATGDVLLFLHIDSVIELDVIHTIEAVLYNPSIIGGGMIQAFSQNDSFFRLASNFGNLRTRITKTFFGDCGIFIRKEVFEKIGGYDEIFMLEDVEFSKKAKKFGKLLQIEAVIITSPRRYFQYGKWKLTFIFSLAVLLNSLGLRPEFVRKFIGDAPYVQL